VEKRNPRQSELQSRVDPQKILEKVLGSQIQIAVGDLIGISKPVTTMLQNIIKPKQAIIASTQPDKKSVVA
ncbi:uncharacterized protein PHACADRAFT_64836, partial [Phanerochaete carnosa HHB-10118-sp]